MKKGGIERFFQAADTEKTTERPKPAAVAKGRRVSARVAEQEERSLLEQVVDVELGEFLSEFGLQREGDSADGDDDSGRLSQLRELATEHQREIELLRKTKELETLLRGDEEEEETEKDGEDGKLSDDEETDEEDHDDEEDDEDNHGKRRRRRRRRKGKGRKRKGGDDDDVDLLMASIKALLPLSGESLFESQPLLSDAPKQFKRKDLKEYHKPADVTSVSKRHRVTLLDTTLVDLVMNLRGETSVFRSGLLSSLLKHVGFPDGLYRWVFQEALFSPDAPTRDSALRLLLLPEARHLMQPAFLRQVMASLSEDQLQPFFQLLLHEAQGPLFGHASERDWWLFCLQSCVLPALLDHSLRGLFPLLQELLLQLIDGIPAASWDLSAYHLQFLDVISSIPQLHQQQTKKQHQQQPREDNHQATDASSSSSSSQEATTPTTLSQEPTQQQDPNRSPLIDLHLLRSLPASSPRTQQLRAMLIVTKMHRMWDLPCPEPSSSSSSSSNDTVFSLPALNALLDHIHLQLLAARTERLDVDWHRLFCFFSLMDSAVNKHSLPKGKGYSDQNVTHLRDVLVLLNGDLHDDSNNAIPTLCKDIIVIMINRLKLFFGDCRRPILAHNPAVDGFNKTKDQSITAWATKQSSPTSFSSSSTNPQVSDD